MYADILCTHKYLLMISRCLISLECYVKVKTKAQLKFYQKP